MLKKYFTLARNKFINTRRTQGFEIAIAVIFRECRIRLFKKLSKVGNISIVHPHAHISAYTSASTNNTHSAVEDKLYERFPNIFPLIPLIPAQRKSGTLNLLVPHVHLRGVFGGIATALIFALYLRDKFKMPLRIICTDGPGDKTALTTFLDEYSLNFNVDNIDFIESAGRNSANKTFLEVHPLDIFIATAWWTAYLAKSLQPHRKFIYLVQDYEPIFYPNGDEKRLANETYLLDGSFIPVVNTKLLFEYFSTYTFKNFQDSLYFEPALDKKIFYPRPKNNTKKKLFFYARTHATRNLYYLGMSAIYKAFREKILDQNSWEVYLAGDELQEVKILSNFSAISLGKMKLKEYAEFARTVDLAISLMESPHPSYPPLELAASGAVVITNKYLTKDDLSRYSKNILLADINEESIVDQIKKYLRMEDKEIAGNLKTNKFLHSWHESFSSVSKEIFQRFDMPRSNG